MRRPRARETDAFAGRLYAATEDADARVLAAVDGVAKARGVPHAQVALAWLLGSDTVTAPIVGATKMEHLDDAVAALAVELTADERRALEAPYVPHAVVGHG